MGFTAGGRQKCLNDVLVVVGKVCRLWRARISAGRDYDLFLKEWRQFVVYELRVLWCGLPVVAVVLVGWWLLNV